MKKIYNNFEEFVEQNKNVLNFLGHKKKGLLAKNKEKGIFRAIWNARQSEIDEYKNQIIKLEHKQDYYFKENEKSQIQIFLENTVRDQIPPCIYPIHHSMDPSEHFNHPINVILRNHNFVIRSLYKNYKEQTALT